MCDSCTREAARLGAELDLLNLTVSVIQAESDAGLSWAGAGRILTDLEMRSGVRFGAIDDLHARTSGLIARLLGGLQDTTTRALLEDLQRLPSPAAVDVLSRLNALASAVNPARLPISAQLGDTVQQITQALAETQVKAAGQLVAEARAQGVPAGLLADQHTLKVSPEQRKILATQAETIAATPVNRVLAAAASARTQVRRNAEGQAVIDAVHDATRALKPAALGDQARQATTGAVNAGRKQALEDAPPPQQVQASELLDKNTCEPCASVDGRVYESLDAALVDYPSGGSYGGCLGGDRCRGTLVAVWSDEVTATINEPGDRPPGAHPIDSTPRGGPSLPSGGAAALPDAVGGTGTPPTGGGQPGTPPPPPPPVVPQPGDPKGDPVSDAVDVSGGNKTFKASMNRALNAIDKAHGDGTLPQVPLKATASTDWLGAYKRAGSSSEWIKIQTTGAWPELTAVHEVGHFLDHQGLGGGAGYASVAGGGLMDDVLSALNASAGIQQLKAIDLSAQTGILLDKSEKFRDYLASEHEMFARAYAQWVAEKTADQILKAQLEISRDSGVKTGFVRQWQTDDFEAIADAIDALMKDRGWTH